MSFFGLDLGPSAAPGLPGQSQTSLAWLDSSGATQSVRFDAVSSEPHDALMQITDHPVEVGANVVDNARELPETIVIDGFVSNKPLASNPGMESVLTLQNVDLTIPKKTPQLSLTTVTGAIGDLLNPPASSATVVTPSGDFADRVRKMHETLTKARQDRSLIRVVTALEDLDSMLITRLSVNRSLADGTGATFHVELRKVRLVSSLSVDAPVPTEARGAVASSKGSKGVTPASPGAEDKAKSVLVKIGAADAVGLRK